MALAVWQSTIVNRSGDVQPNAQVEVRLESSGALAAIYADRDGNTPLGNPFTADENGFARFYAAGGAYKITASLGDFSQTYRHVAIGMLGEQDVTQDDQFYYRQTAAEIAAGVTPSDYSGSSRPWTDAVKRYGLVGDGATDNAAAFTRMFSVAGQALFIKRGDYVCSTSQNIPANTTIYFEPGTIIRDGGELPNQAFWRIDDVDNVHIIGWGAKIVMDRDDYTTDEQRHGLRIRGACANVCVEGLESSNTGGDGFNIGTLDATQGVPTNIRLVQVKADNNRRNGLSITCGRNVYVVDSQFANTTGTAPEAGIDIEPNDETDVLDNICLINTKTDNNDQQGVKIYLGALDNTSDPITINVVNHVDVGSAYGLTVHEATGGCRGNIRVHSPIWKENLQFGFASVSCNVDNVLVELFDPTVIDCNQNGSSADLAGAAYAIYRDSGSTKSGSIGGVHIYNPDVQVTLSETPVVTFYVANSDEPGEVEDVRIIDPKNVEFSAVGPTAFGTSPVYLTDRHGVMTLALTSSADITATRHFSKYTNSGAAGTITLDLADWPIDGRERTFEVHEAQTINIRADQVNAANRIFPGSYTALRCNEVGGRITLKKGEGGYWITNMVGVWHNNEKFSLTNDTTDRTLDADAAAVAETNDVLATLIRSLRWG